MSADGWNSAITGLGSWNPDFITVDDPDKPTASPSAPAQESDDSLRNRLLYVAGDGDYNIHRILQAEGVGLDVIAAECGLKRRGTP